MTRKQILGLSAALLALAGCQANPLKITRTACPAVAIVKNTGTVTLFQPEISRDADAIDVSAQISALNGSCDQNRSTIDTAVTLEVSAVRSRVGGGRDVTLPLFIAIIQQGQTVVAKQTQPVTLRFADGQARASSRQTLSTTLNRASAEKLLPPAPTNEEEAARRIQASPFEVLVGFQLTDDQAVYNLSR